MVRITLMLPLTTVCLGRSSFDQFPTVWKFTLRRCIEAASNQHHNVSQHDTTEGAVTGNSAAQLTSEEKYVDSRFEHAKSLCSNSVRKNVFVVPDFTPLHILIVWQHLYSLHYVMYLFVLCGTVSVSKGGRHRC